jgi:DNA topoisomerase-1
MVDAQQARRILDRLVGYSISPLLWKKVRKGLSAGRVQSVAVRLVVSREREIEKFISREYWKLEVDLATEAGDIFPALVTHGQGKKLELANEAETQEVVKALRESDYIVSKVARKEQRRYPAPPFITSKLQQEASSKLRFTAKKTMMVAQQLYEGLEIGDEGSVGLITYMRTDSVRVNTEVQALARELIAQAFGPDFAPAQPPNYKMKKQVQDAHEAVHPTSLVKNRAPESLKKFLTPDQYKLYRLIWQRFLASQMTPAVFDATLVEIEAGEYGLRASGSIMRFRGFMAAYTEALADQASGEPSAEENKLLPPLSEQQTLLLKEIRPEQKFTQPPARYNDATLVKAMEENNIGRPSTYAPVMSTILARKYIERKEARFHPTELGIIINDLLVENFPDILNIEFTADLENELDAIETGETSWVKVLKGFYEPFKLEMEKAKKDMRDIKSQVEVEVEGEECEKCGAKLLVKWGKHGKFIACSNYPACRNTKQLGEDNQGRIMAKPEETVDEVCEKCGSPMQIKYGRFGKFMACSRYPDCKSTKSINQEIGVSCPQPECGGQIIERKSKRGRFFYGCSNYPRCDFVSWDKPLAEVCPQCGNLYLVRKYSKKQGLQVICPGENCTYSRSEKSEDESNKPS